MKTIDRKEIQKVLIIRNDRLGDVILTLPLVNAVRDIFPDAVITFLARNYPAELIKDYKGINELIREEESGNFFKKYSYFKKNKTDLVINVKPCFEYALLFFLLNVNYRIGTAYRWYSFLYNFKVHEHRKHSVRHESDYNINLLGNFFSELKPRKDFYFSYTDSERKKLSDKLNGLTEEKFIIIHPGSGGSARDLPVEILKEFAGLFSSEFSEYRIVLTGAGAEKEMINDLKFSAETEYNIEITDLCDKLNLKELMILTDCSALFISNSTGPIHIAGALNKNIIGFYPDEIPVNEIRWKPLSSNTVIMKPGKNGSMNEIKASEILKEAEKILNKNNQIKS